MFGRGVLEKADLISQLVSIQRRHAKHGDVFEFDFYVAMTFASDKLTDEVAALVQSLEGKEFEAAFKAKMGPYRERLVAAPVKIKKSLIHYLGRRQGKLESFDDLVAVLKQLNK